MIMSFKEFIAIKKIRVEVPAAFAPPASETESIEALDEATRATVRRFTARRDPPHFQGDEYHAHSEIPGGYEVSWGVSGKRRHPNKFPVDVPADARAAVAKVLNVDPNLLEGYVIADEKLGEKVFLLELTTHHDYKIVPWPRQTTKFPEHWPSDVGRYWLQAQRSLEGKNWDAAALMARSAIQLIMRYQKASGANLKNEIDDLAHKGILPPVMKDWAHEVRALGNENAHPNPGESGTSQKDARDAARSSAEPGPGIFVCSVQPAAFSATLAFQDNPKGRQVNDVACHV
jgi:hypothetical protein